MYRILKTSGEVQTGDTITLKEAQGIVKGYVEVIKLPKKKFMLVDEEAKLKIHPEVNTKASDLVGMLIYGDVVVLDKMGDLKG